MGSLSIWHWLIVLLVVVLVFGTRKLRDIGSDLGGAVREFKDAMKADDDSARHLLDGRQVIDGEAKTGTHGKA